MTWEDILKIVAGVLASIGGGGAIVFGLSSWLGKVWADRLLEKERASYAKDLEKARADYAREIEQLRSQLTLSNEKELNNIKQELEILKHTRIQEHQDKLAIYRMVADIFAKLFSTLDELKSNELLPSDLSAEFNRERMRAYGYLSMLASQEVMDSYDSLSDFMLDVMTGHKKYDWIMVRPLILDLINKIRIDVGLNKNPIDYRGEN